MQEKQNNKRIKENKEKKEKYENNMKMTLNGDTPAVDIRYNK